MEEKNETGGKLKSRKWWIVVAACAYCAVMAIKEQGMNSTPAELIYIAGIVIVVVCYVIIEGRIDSDKIIEGESEEDNE